MVKLVCMPIRYLARDLGRFNALEQTLHSPLHTY